VQIFFAHLPFFFLFWVFRRIEFGALWTKLGSSAARSSVFENWGGRSRRRRRRRRRQDGRK
jgi:hypothetical protein